MNLMINFRWIILILFLFVSISEFATVGKNIQIPDKDPTLKTLVYKIGLPDANAKIHDSVLWVPATTQFSASRITVISRGRPYSSWTFSMLLQRSNCLTANTPITDLQGCKPISSSSKTLCNAYVSLFDGDYSSYDSEVHCYKV